MKIKNKIAAMSLISLIDAGLVGCNAETETPMSLEPETIVDVPVNLSNDDNKVEETKEETTDETTTEETETVDMRTVPTIVATTNVNIRDEEIIDGEITGNIIGTLGEGQDLENFGKTENGNYVVNWYGSIGYIKGDYVVESTKSEILAPIDKVLYAEEDITLTVPAYLSEDGNDYTVTLPKNECLEVYDEIGDYYLVSTNEYVGYVDKSESLGSLDDTFVVVDISDQELKLYKDNEIMLTTPVVTGSKSNPSDEGLFSIYDISYSRDLVGPGYRSYVDIMMKYNGGEGLHDAEYHTCNKSHGWRNASEFGGNTYLTNGSHGCVNMLHDDVFTVSDYVDIGTKVLVKK